MPHLPVGPLSTAPALERLAVRSRVSALWLLLAAAAVVPAWSVVDLLLEGPAIAERFIGPRVLCSLVMLAAAGVVWR